MDPKIFFETGQTSGKNVSGTATDTSGETTKQAGRAFKEAFNAANVAGNVDPEGTSSPGKVDPKGITSIGSSDPKATATSEQIHYTALPNAGNVGSRAYELMAKAPLDHEVLASAQPIGFGKSLPHTQETGNFDPPDNKRGSGLTLDPKALVDGTKPEAESQRWVAETMELVSREAKDAIRGASNSQLSRSESSAARPESYVPNTYSPHTEFISQPVDSKTENGSIVRVKGPQGLMEIALPNGPASVVEIAEFAESQTLPNSFITQVLSDFKGSALPASNDLLLAEQLTTATRVFEVDTGLEVESGVDAGESGLSANTALSPEKGPLGQIEKLAESTIFIDQLASVLAPKVEWNPSTQQAVAIDRGEVVALIKRALSSNDGFMTKGHVATYELSSEAIQIRGAIIDAIGSDKAMKLSEFDVNKLANLLEPKFVNAVAPRVELAARTQPPVESIRAAHTIGVNSLWALNDNGDLTTSKAQLDAQYRFGVSASAIGTPDRPRQIELDSSVKVAQELDGLNPKGPSSAEGKFEILDVEALTRQKTFTSSDALNLRNFANNRGADDAPTARALSSNPLVAPVLPESQSLPSAAPLTNSLGDQGGVNYFAASGTGYPLVSRSTNSEGSRATQYQSSVHTVRDVVALSERFSQVLTERLVQNVKSGNYNLRFNVHPRELGAVDIAMEVRDGRLDAQISSTNPVTRDLLSESLPRLRDALQAGGLQLSNLEVNDNTRDNQKRGLMPSNDRDDSAIELNETASNLLVEDLTLDAESVDYLA